MKCAQCGAQIRESNSFCDECGARVKVRSLSNTSGDRSNGVQEISLDINLELIPANMRTEIEEKYKDDPVLKEQIYKKITQMMIDKQQKSSSQKQAEANINAVDTQESKELHNISTDSYNKQIEGKNKKEEKPREVTQNKRNSLNKDSNLSKKTSTNKRDRTIKKDVKVSKSISEPTNIFSMITLLVRNPLLSNNDLAWCMSGRNVIADAIKLVIGGAIMTAISFNVIAIRMIYALISMFGDFFILMGSSVISASNAEDVTNDIMQTPFMQDTGFKIIMYPLLSHIILMGLMSLLILGIFKILRKQDVTFGDCILAMLTPLAILLVGKILVFLLAFVSGTIAAYVYVLLMGLTVVVMIFQIVNLLGVSTFTIYVVPIIYIVCALVRNIVIMELIKGSMSAYILYF